MRRGATATASAAQPCLLPPPRPTRRKKKAVHKTASTDDKRLQTTLKRLGVNTIPGIEEVLLLSDDGTALQFTNPKVQASIAANTYVVTGPAQAKRERRRCRCRCCGLCAATAVASASAAAVEEEGGRRRWR